ncbi:MAG: nucleotide exchange factor GrpE [Spirochaetales bacterium]
MPDDDKEAAEPANDAKATAVDAAPTLVATVFQADLDSVTAELESSRKQASDLETLVAEQKALVADLQDQLLRKAADFDNYRKRMLKEKEEARLFANTGLLEDLVDVLDNFERAIRSSEAARDYDGFHSGIVMIEDQFASMLERKYNLKKMDSAGKPFAPELHEAIAMEPAAEGQDIVVVEEYQKGYQLHDRVLRTAKVKVGPAAKEEKKGE